MNLAIILLQFLLYFINLIGYRYLYTMGTGNVANLGGKGLGKIRN